MADAMEDMIMAAVEDIEIQDIRKEALKNEKAD